MSQELLDLMIQDEVIGPGDIYWLHPDSGLPARLVIKSNKRGCRLLVYPTSNFELSWQFVEACRDTFSKLYSGGVDIEEVRRICHGY